jgi:hypothetical protein
MSIALIALGLWKLTLPVDSAGKFTGRAKEVYSITEYSDKYFTPSVKDQSITFTVPVEGATTSGSHYPRSELREMKTSKDEAAWTVAQGGTLKATVAVNVVPTRKDKTAPRLVIGQIHGKTDELCRLYYQGGKVYYVTDKAGPKNKETTFLLKDKNGKEPSVDLNEKIDYTINVAGGNLTVTVVADGITYSNVQKINTFFLKDKLYFKAGMYSGVNATQATGIAQNTFYAISVSHP